MAGLCGAHAAVDLTAMAIDYAEKEREFLESLQEDTGRDLSGWMAAIAATNLSERNAIIHWLRQQGFLFAKASWLERIFHNGGRPIYLDRAAFETSPEKSGAVTPPTPARAAEVAPPRLTALSAPPPAATPTAPRPAPLPPVVRDPPSSLVPPSSLEALLAEAKAYRPLAQYVVREIGKACPSITAEARPGYVAFLKGQRLAGVLTIGPKELRLALALGDRMAPLPFTKARFPRTSLELPQDLTHMLVLTDARQITPELVAIVAAAADLS